MGTIAHPANNINTNTIIGVFIPYLLQNLLSSIAYSAILMPRVLVSNITILLGESSDKPEPINIFVAFQKDIRQ